MDSRRQTLPGGRATRISSSTSTSRVGPLNIQTKEIAEEQRPELKSESCWEAACQQLREKKREKFDRLFSASGVDSLEEHDLRQRLQSVANNEKPGRIEKLLQRAQEIIRPLKEISMTAARRDPHGLAPFAVGGLFLLLEVCTFSHYLDFFSQFSSADMSKIFVGTEYIEYVLDLISELNDFVMVWCHFETRVLNIFDPSLDGIDKHMAEFRIELVQLFYQILDLSGSLLEYLGKGKAGQSGMLRSCLLN